MKSYSNLKRVFDLSEEDFLSQNKKSTSHVQSYFDQSIDYRFTDFLHI